MVALPRPVPQARRAAATGSADLPLHGGRVPPWLFHRMARLGRVLAEAIVHHYGRAELLRRLAHPFWFQSLGAVMGMDWHSSGITTSVVGALQRGLAPLECELGLKVCGGRARHSRKTPDELVAFGARAGVDGEALAPHEPPRREGGRSARAGRVRALPARVRGRRRWGVGGRAAGDDRRAAGGAAIPLALGWARLIRTHAAIEGRPGGEIVNLTDRRAAAARAAQLALLGAGPDRILAALRSPAAAPHLSMPSRHAVTAGDLQLRRLHGALAAAASRGPRDFPELLLTPGVGARTMLALAMAAEMVHGTPVRFSDPARFSLAHGGKDGHPFPVPIRVYDETIGVLRRAVDRAHLGQEDKLAAIRSLDAEARRLEAAAGGPELETFVEAERTASPAYGGRTVMGRAVRATNGRSSNDPTTKRPEPEPRPATEAPARRREPGRASDRPVQLGLPLGR